MRKYNNNILTRTLCNKTKKILCVGIDIGLYMKDAFKPTLLVGSSSNDTTVVVVWEVIQVEDTNYKNLLEIITLDKDLNKTLIKLN